MKKVSFNNPMRHPELLKNMLGRKQQSDRVLFPPEDTGRKKPGKCLIEI